LPSSAASSHRPSSIASRIFRYVEIFWSSQLPRRVRRPSAGKYSIRVSAVVATQALLCRPCGEHTIPVPIPKGASVERVCFTFEIRPGTADEYKKRHDEIWPELVDAIKDAGFANYSLFRRGTTIMAYAECHPDVASAFAKI